MKKSIPTLLVLMIISTSTIFAQTNAVRLKIEGNGFSDETIIRLVDGATPDFDGAFDAWKFISPNPDVPSIYTKIPSNDDLSINSLPILDNDTSIHVHTKVPAFGVYTITIEEIFAFDEEFIISVTDLDNNENYIFNGGTSTFTCVLSPTTATPSFNFNITKHLSTAINPILENNDFTLATKGNGNFGFIFNDNQVKNIVVYDITGKTVMNDRINSTNYNLNLANMPSGLYVVAINNGKETITRKIFR